MTLIVVLTCKAGIVMASDGQATVSSTGGPIRQTYTKIRRIGKSILWAGSGDVGCLQKLEKAIEQLPAESKTGGINGFVVLVVKIIHRIRSEALDRFRDLYGKVDGEYKAPSNETMLADCTSGVPKIIHLSRDGQDTELQEFGFGAIGIGDTFAYTILKNYNIKNLTIEQGKALAYLVIKDAIETGAYGLGEPIDIWTITQVEEEGKKIDKAVKVAREEMEALKDVYNSIKQAEAEIFGKIVK